MSKVFRKTYKFASITSVSIAVILSFFNGIYFLINESFHLWFWILEFTVIFIISFFIIQYRVENFIYKRIKKIYDDVSLLEKSALGPQKITTDMETLTKEVELFARNKKLEIEALKIREGYRREFTGNVSHELKTPLFTVQGYIETLINGASNDEKLRKKYLERASKGVERLIFIVKDLDMITKLEVGELSLKKEKFNIIELIKNVFELLEMKASKNDILFTFDKQYTKPILVKADKDRIQQVLSNLIVNSIKYGRTNGTTEISIENLIMNKIIFSLAFLVSFISFGQSVLSPNVNNNSLDLKLKPLPAFPSNYKLLNTPPGKTINQSYPSNGYSLFIMPGKLIIGVLKGF